MFLRQRLIAAAVCVLASSAFADDAHHREAAQPPAANVPAPDSQSPCMNMGAMQVHMKEMQEQMSKWRATSDAKERERLMDEHMKTMQESMSMMQKMMGAMR